MTDWQKSFFRESWTRAFWKRHFNHVALHFEGHRDVLLVGFTSEFANSNSRNWAPWGGAYAQEADINYLGFSSNVADWYLDEWIDEQFQELVEDGFFDRFSRVVFIGHSMGGYAALRYSRLVPTSHVVAFSPQTTLESGRAEFDARYPDAWRHPWRGDDTDAGAQIYDTARSFVFYDPYCKEDAAHAARLETAGARLLRCYHSGHGSFIFLNRIGIVPELMQEILFGSFEPRHFYRLFRLRRTLPWFRKALEAHFRAADRPEMLARIARAMEEMDDELVQSRHQPHATATL